MQIEYSVEQRGLPRHRVWFFTGCMLLLIALLFAAQLVYATYETVTTTGVVPAFWVQQAILALASAVAGGILASLHAKPWKQPWRVQWTPTHIHCVTDSGAVREVHWKDLVAVEEEPAPHSPKDSILIPVKSQISDLDDGALEYRVESGHPDLHFVYFTLKNKQKTVVPVPAHNIAYVRKMIMQYTTVPTNAYAPAISRAWKIMLAVCFPILLLAMLFNAVVLTLIFVVLLSCGHALYHVLRYKQTFIAGGVVHGRAAYVVGSLYVFVSVALLHVMQRVIVQLL
jgi:hypothetical protein